MSVVIIGGHDRMVCQYKKICRQFNCKAKVFTQMSANLSKQIGSPDLIKWCAAQWKRQEDAMQTLSAAIQAARMRLKRSSEASVHKLRVWRRRFLI